VKKGHSHVLRLVDQSTQEADANTHRKTESNRFRSMSSLATRRLINAAATLDAADRALLNLWVNRGFDTNRLAALSGMSPDTLGTRRERIVERLSEELGLPPDHVRVALEDLAASAREAVAAEPNGASAAGREPAHAPNGSMVPAVAGLLLGPGATARTPPVATAGLLLGPGAARAADAAVESSPPDPAAIEPPAPEPAVVAPPPAAPGGRRDRRRVWLTLGLLAVVCLGVVIAALASGGTPAAHGTTRVASAPTTVASTPPVTAAAGPSPTPAPPTRTAGGPVTPLVGLPGGLAHAHGTIQLTGPMKNLGLRLRLSVSGLPTPHGGHYEVWLFNSVLDSESLGRLRAGAGRVTYPMPANARRYGWIDISWQPGGAVNHSGESELRATNPARTTTARRRRPATPGPHQLRRAGRARGLTRMPSEPRPPR
jgi:hypothetical protein